MSFLVARGLLVLVALAGCGQRTALRSTTGGKPRSDASVAAPDAPDASDAAAVAERLPVDVGGDAGCEAWPVPEGRFTVVTSGKGSSCGIRTDGTLACWGAPPYARSAVPTGSFLRVSAYLCSCGVRDSGRLACWGCDTSPPAGAVFLDVGRGEEAQCALRLDGKTACWGPLVRAENIPAYKFDALSGGAFYTCGIEVSGRWAVCWDPRRGRDSLSLTKGPFNQVGVGRSFACGLLMDGTPQCWSLEDPSENHAPPATTFRELSVGDVSACGLKDDGSITCWGSNRDGEATPPAGARFLHVSVGATHSCGILLDGTLQCWGRLPDSCAPG